MANPAPASVRQAAARATLELPFTVPAKDWFSLRETAALSGMQETFVEKKFDEGKDLAGHKHNAGSGLRHTKRVPRIWLVAFLLKTATYDNESLVDALIACIRPLSRELLLRIAAAAKKFAEDKPISS